MDTALYRDKNALIEAEISQFQGLYLPVMSYEILLLLIAVSLNQSIFEYMHSLSNEKNTLVVDEYIRWIPLFIGIETL